ncbi:MAG: hypothetical protein AAGU06_01110 [Candidatus Shapirobacteria bacterium]
MNQIDIEINQKRELLASRILYKKELEKQLSQITNSRFYVKWQKLNKVKKFLNPKFYVKYLNKKLNKYIYNLSEFEAPHHDFIILTKESNNWKFDGYEKVGEDWHIKIIRKSDNRQFLLDQPIFYYLQIFNNKEINLENELFITYGLTNKKIKKIKKSVELLKLC